MPLSLQQHGGRNRPHASARDLVHEVRETMGAPVADAPALVPAQVSAADGEAAEIATPAKI